MKTLSTKKTGRPTVVTAETITKLESIFKIGGNDAEAISYAGIGARTYYDHLEADEDFRSKMDSAKHYADIVAKNVVIDAIVKDKDLGTAKWWLEKKHPDFKESNQAPFALQVNNYIGEKKNDYGI